ncbi:hypothetical protein ACVDNA_000559 [Campylobacter jejuni]|nr:hypothetical protein [Campylobacter jejuni]HEF5242069.1 hypothetical protein [Campylobacter jejuni]HEG2181582.1 hypothetical protein [Campylobacter jejuni]HEG2792369.1 hypothetical protein [Campylobacter jejuni]HEG5832112.1 hypothetical protein [Campylobacter jejuni]
MQIIEPKNKNFLTPKQLECEFGISLSKQYKMRMQKNQNQANSLPFIKLGKTFYIKEVRLKYG